MVEILEGSDKIHRRLTRPSELHDFVPSLILIVKQIASIQNASQINLRTSSRIGVMITAEVSAQIPLKQYLCFATQKDLRAQNGIFNEIPMKYL